MLRRIMKKDYKNSEYRNFTMEVYIPSSRYCLIPEKEKTAA